MPALHLTLRRVYTNQPKPDTRRDFAGALGRPRRARRPAAHRAAQRRTRNRGRQVPLGVGLLRTARVAQRPTRRGTVTGEQLLLAVPQHLRVDVAVAQLRKWRAGELRKLLS